jgi:hypothetical protein
MKEFIEKLKEENEENKENRDFYMNEKENAILMLNAQNKIEFNNKLIELAELLNNQ